MTESAAAQDPQLRERLGFGLLDLPSGGGVAFEDVLRFSYASQPELNPKATAIRLTRVLGRSFTEKEARATAQEIERFRRQRAEQAGEELAWEDAVRAWDREHGHAFRRRWFLNRPEPDERRYVPGGRERGPTAVDRAAGLILPELRPLLEAGFGVVDLLFHAAREPRPSARLVLGRVPKAKRRTYYLRLVADLTGWDLSEEEAERVWEECLKHKARMCERAGHDVPIERAVVDYFKRLRLSGLDRAALWEQGRPFAPSSGLEEPDGAPSTAPREQFPA